MTDSIGRLRARIMLEQPQAAADDMGGGAITYVGVETVWADVESRAATQRSDYDDRVSGNAYRLTIRAPSAVRPGWRARWGARSVLVAAVAPLGDARVVLDCEESQ